MKTGNQEPAYIQQALDDIDSGIVPAQIESGMPVPLGILALMSSLAVALLITGLIFSIYGERSLSLAVFQLNPIGLALIGLGLAFTVAVVVLVIKCVEELIGLVH